MKMRSLAMKALFLGVVSACVVKPEPIDIAAKYVPDEEVANSELSRITLKDDEYAKPESQEGMLTLRQCIDIALAENPTREAASQGVISAKESTLAAYAPYYPDLSIQSSGSRWQRRIFLPSGLEVPGLNIPPTVGPTEEWLYALRSRITLFDGGERNARLRQAMAGETAASMDADRTKQEIVFNVSRSFYAYAAAREICEVAKRNYERAGDHFRLATERYTAGAAAQTDVLRSKVEESNARLSLVQADDLVRISSGNLKTAMGMPVEADLHVIATALEPIILPGEETLNQGLETAAKVRPEIRRAGYMLRALESAVSLAESQYYPRLRAEGLYGRHDAQFPADEKEWSAGLTVEQPLFTGFSTVHTVAQAEAEYRKEESNVRQLVLLIRQEVWNAFSKIREAFEAVQAAKTLKADAEENLRSSRERYTSGAIAIADLLDAEVFLARAEASSAQAHWDYYEALAAWRRAVGETVGTN